MVVKTTNPSSNKQSGNLLEILNGGNRNSSSKPLANFMTFKSKEDEINYKYLQRIKNMKRRMVEVENLDEDEAINWAWIYTELAPDDVNGSISIRRVKSFFETYVKSNNPQMYQKIITFFDFRREEKSEHKELKQLRLLQSYLNTLRTLENAYQYSAVVHDVIDKIAPKLDAPSDMDTLTRVKWLRIWITLIRDQSFFWTDLDNEYRLLPYSKVSIYNSLYVMPETLETLWKHYFSKLEDGEIIYEMVDGLVKQFPETVQKLVRDFGELDENRTDNIKVERIRMEIKQKLFPNYWRATPSYFCTRDGIRTLNAEVMIRAIEADKNGGIEKLPTKEASVANSFNGFKPKKYKVYEFAEIAIGGKTEKPSVSCNEELGMYRLAYTWLENHPDFCFGEEKMTFAEYGLVGYFDEKPDSKEIIASWILQMGFARDEEDIQWEMAEEFFEGKDDILEKYLKGEISNEDIFEIFGFTSDTQAIACFSLASKIATEDAKRMPQALKRIKMFGVDKSIQSDLIYLKLFRNLATNKPEVLPKGLARQYEILIK